MEITEISNKIKDTIRPLMDKWEDDFYSLIKELQPYCDYQVYKEADENFKNGTNRHKWYSNEVFYLKEKKGYTKSMEFFFHRSDDDLKAKIHREAEQKMLKIDVAVAKKLKDIDVKSVELRYCGGGRDGYVEGRWLINDEFIFEFHTFYAGGYNIQCLHIRTKYNLSKKK